ncbi:MAG: extracellular solute-binding protein [Oligoflexia bacterium]|nr:extracellular solute-binding protein [Oligoflexia bacterium]
MRETPRTRLKGFLSHLALLTCLAAVPGALAASAPIPDPPALRFLLPHALFSQSGDQELKTLVEEYNRAHPKGKVELLFRGENFSSLKELVAFHLAGDLPELAAVETSELPAVARMGITRRTLPFRRSLPVLVRADETGAAVPGTWATLLNAFQRSSAPAPSPSENRATEATLALPLQGPLGLWMFEALSGKELWRRETGGLRTNRELKPLIAELQHLIDSPQVLRPEETWERAIQAFLDRRSPMLVTSLDSLPYLSSQSTFRWNAGLLPVFSGGTSQLVGGSTLVVTRESPEVKQFLDYLYSRKVAMRWVAQGNFLPLEPGWVRSPEWKKLVHAMPVYARLVAQAKGTQPRSTDPDVVRAHSEWLQALRLLFTDASRRVPADTVLTQMDTHLSLGKY